MAIRFDGRVFDSPSDLYLAGFRAGARAYGNRIAEVLVEAADAIATHRGHVDPVDALRLAMGETREQISQSNMAYGRTVAAMAAFEYLARIEEEPC